ncbi:MAG: indolepyruvate ferredoxin oxidoreductase subunit alpha [Planctomycetota bacterium]|jgi:ferredoxin
MPAKIDKGKCTGCESCVDECPSEAISIVEERAQVDLDTCVDCGVCIEACPAEAISVE